MSEAATDNPKVRRIFKAVRTVLAGHGYAGTTISLVAREAGISRGLLHYYFKNKEDMLARAIEASVVSSLGAVATTFEQSRTSEDVARGLCKSLRDIIEGDPDFIPLILEGWAVSRRIPAVADQIAINYLRIRKAVRHELETLAVRGIIAPKIPAEELARLFIGIFDGLGIQLVFEPDLISDKRIWKATEAAVRILLSGVE